jgi:hypothetical protein
MMSMTLCATPLCLYATELEKKMEKRLCLPILYSEHAVLQLIVKIINFVIITTRK